MDERRYATGRTPALALISCCTAIGIALASRDAGAQSISRFTLRGELGGGSMLPDYQRSQLKYNLAFQASTRLGVTVLDPLAVHVTVSEWWFPSDSRDGNLVMLGGGLRFQPSIARIGRPFIEAEAGVGLTGDFARFTLDGAVGFEFRITDWISVGPVGRYGRVFTSGNDFHVDAEFWSVGASIAMRIPESRPAVVPPTPEPEPMVVLPPADTDGDGVADADDVCPDDPSGAHPDAARVGCPLHDTDGDLVYDDVDACVEVPAGEHPDPDRAGCPDGDADTDRFLNHADECRDVHAGLHPDPQRPGCPLADRDGDTVPDAEDRCPDQAGAPQANPRRNGCPGLVRVENGQVRILRPVQFATNRDRILRSSEPVLRAVAYVLQATPTIVRLTVDGHTDNAGDDAHNLDLSRRRAISVMAWLLTHGVDPARLEAHGYGETHPLVSNDTRPGRALNRRVEFLIVDPAVSAPEPAAANANANANNTAPPAVPATPVAPVTSSADHGRTSRASRHGHGTARAPRVQPTTASVASAGPTVQSAAAPTAPAESAATFTPASAP